MWTRVALSPSVVLELAGSFSNVALSCFHVIECVTMSQVENVYGTVQDADGCHQLSDDGGYATTFGYMRAPIWKHCQIREHHETKVSIAVAVG